MTRKKLFLTAVTLLLAVFGGGGKISADTTKLLEADGWTKITSLPTSSDIESNYYVFVDNTNDLMLGIAKGVNQNTKWYSLGVFYQSSVEPTSSEMNGKTWILETQGEGFAMRNLEYSVSPFQTEWGAAWKFDTNDVYTTSNDWCKIILTYADGSWTIQNGKYPESGYLGPWTDGNFTNGAECAANKTGSNMGHFQIYAISRTQYQQNLIDNASSSNPVDLTPWYVTNSTFDANNGDGWEKSFSANSAGWWGNYTFGNLGAENYQQVADINQTLTLPNGKYKVTLQGASNKANENLSYVYATHNDNTVKTYFTQSTVSSDVSGLNDMQYNLLLMMQDRSYAQVHTPEITVTTGSLTIGYKNEGGWSWDVYDNFKLMYYGIDLTILKDAYEAALSNANTAWGLRTTTYAHVTGSEKIALENALTTYATCEDTQSAYETATSALNSAKDAFIAAKTNYDLLYTEIEKATSLGVDATAYTPTATTTAATTITDLQNLKVKEYNFVTTNYQYGVNLGEWTSNATGTSAATFSNEHWSGTTHEYKNQNDNDGQGWNNASGWSINFNQNVTLPAGNYVFKVAGRRASGNGMTMSLIVKNGEEELGKVNDFPESNNSRGINKSGETAFEGDDADFANGGKGFGWEWRYVKFTLATNATVNLAIDATATTGHQWLSFGDYTLQTDNEANISLIAYNIALNDAVIAISDDTYVNVTGAEKTDLQALIDGDATLDKTNKIAIDNATDDLKTKTAAFIAAKNAYDTFVEAKAITCTELPYASATKFAAIATAKATAAPTSASDATTKANAILSAYRKYVESNALAEGVVGAESITISDPNLNVTYDSENHKFGAWQVIGQTNGNIQLLSSQSFTDGDGNADYKYADIYKNDNNAGIQQTVNLAPGKYILTVTARAQATEGASFILFAGDKTTNIERIGATGGTYDKGWNDATVEFIVNETSDVNIGVQSGNGKDLWWSATRFRLTKIAGVENIDMNITAAEWATFIAPFEVTIPDGVKAYTVEGIEGETLQKTELTTTIPANTPVLLNGPADTYPVSGVNIATEDSYTEGILVGVYKDQAVTSNGANDVYVLQKQDDGLGFYKVSTDAAEAPTVKANRAYIKLASGGGIKALFFDDDEATAIESIDVQTAGEYDAIYTATGVKVNSLQKGLNIVVKNGKSYKIFVK